jgi:hypothetical protein
MKEGVVMSDDFFTLCVLRDLNTGDHQVFGGVTKINYGYRSTGDTFLVHKNDIAGQPDLFVPVTQYQTVKEVEVVFDATKNYVDETIPEVKDAVVEAPTARSQVVSSVAPPTIEMPKLISRASIVPYDFREITSDTTISVLKKSNITTPEDVMRVGVMGLRAIKGIGSLKANNIYNSCAKYLSMKGRN